MKIPKLIASLAISYAAAVLGSLATTPNIPTWYAGLDKPFFNPPNWLFGPVWSVLYTLIGISLYLLWTSETPASKRKAYMLFGVQLVLNALWSIVFFGLHQSWAAVPIIGLLLAGIIGYMVSVRTISRAAAWLMLPYLLWVGFATCLNIAIAILN